MIKEQQEMAKQFHLAIKEVRKWEEKYDLLASTAPEKVTLMKANDLSQELTLVIAPTTDGRGVAWFDENGARLPKSVGWVVREFALS